MSVQVYEYVVVFEPTEKETEEKNLRPKIVVEPATVVAGSDKQAAIAAARALPAEYEDKLDQIHVIVRPF